MSSFGAVLERKAAELRTSPRVRSWARARLQDLDELGPAMAFASAVGRGVGAVITGWFETADHLRELLEQLAGGRSEQ